MTENETMKQKFGSKESYFFADYMNPHLIEVSNFRKKEEKKNRGQK
jgi:hypothetical protein